MKQELEFIKNEKLSNSEDINNEDKKRLRLDNEGNPAKKASKVCKFLMILSVLLILTDFISCLSNTWFLPKYLFRI